MDATLRIKMYFAKMEGDNVIEITDEHGDSSFSNGGGWSSKEEMLKNRLPHYANHPTERAVEIPNGFRVIERTSIYVREGKHKGMRVFRIIDVTYHEAGR